MSPVFDVVVIGGGPAGLMAAGRAAEAGASVVVLEKNEKPGKKLLITGGGRCNICNAEFDDRRLSERYGKRGKALLTPFSLFNAQSTFDFFQGRGLRLKVEAENRAFPESEKAEDVWKTMVAYAKDAGAEIRCNQAVSGFVLKDGVIDAVSTAKGPVRGKAYVVATGGASHPETGSTGDAFAWLEAAGHTVVRPSTALVPVAVKEPWVKDLMGVSFKHAKLSVWQAGKKRDERAGKILFTHFGLSGPLVLNMSRGIGDLLEAGAVTLSLDLYPKLDPGAMDRAVLAVLEANKNKLLKNATGELFPPRMAAAVFSQAGIDGDTPGYRLSKEHRAALAKTLKDLRLTASHLLGEDKAIVTSGGAELKEVDFRTMRSKKHANLYLAGDVLDFDRPSGGFSLQLCWTTGWIAGGAAAGA